MPEASQQPRLGARFLGLRAVGPNEVAADFEVGSRRASVRIACVGSRLRFEFPHIADDTGESVGSPERDAAVIGQACVIAAVLDAGLVWRSFRRGAA